MTKDNVYHVKIGTAYHCAVVVVSTSPHLGGSQFDLGPEDQLS